MKRRRFLASAGAFTAAAVLAPAAALARVAPAPAAAVGADDAGALTDVEREHIAAAALMFLLSHPTLRRGLTIEAVCAAFVADGIELRSRELPPDAAAFVTRLEFGGDRVEFLQVARQLEPERQARALLVGWAHLRVYHESHRAAAVVWMDPAAEIRANRPTRYAEAFADAVLAGVGQEAAPC